MYNALIIIVGPGKLPQLGGAIGKAMKSFRKASVMANHRWLQLGMVSILVGECKLHLLPG
ncbi:MAG: twin-arginine translocase TatA/TatE family subunit [Bacillota bacterium]|nr:twin-arginine translocase TatA/TatE family subunit [Bacillota bacterium]